MSLVRTALRLQAIEALNSDPVLDGFVQGRVYDSRISAFDHREPVPVIVVTTEESAGKAWSHQNGGAPFGLACDLVLEIAMNAVGPVEMADGTTAEAIGYAATDRELEADLDLIEERAIAVLTCGETAPAQLLQTIVKRASSVATSRFSSDQTAEKFAVHLLTLRVELFEAQEDDPFAPPSGPFAALPLPLRAVAEASEPDGSVRATCLRLVARSAPALLVSAAPSFAGADMVLAPQPLVLDTAPDRAADVAAGRTVGFAADPPIT